MSNFRATIPSLTRAKLSEEPGFILVDLHKSNPAQIPNRTAGLLAFLYVDHNWESVIKILLCDDLARSFLENRPFSGRANRIAYHAFAPVNDSILRVDELRKHLQLHARLIDNYCASSSEIGY